MDGESLGLQASALDSKLGDDMDLDDTESVVSDLSTDEFTTDVSTDLSDALNRIGVPKPFVSLNTLPDFPGGVSIEGVGDINAPLDEAQARQIIACHDDDIREDEDDGGFLLQLTSDQFTLDDSIWPNIIQGCVDQAARDRNITTPLIADSLFLVLFQHKHTCRKEYLLTINGCLGTMTIFLPSTHKGGEMVVKNGETEELLFASNQTAQSFPKGNLEIESRSVESGYIWALIYAIDPHPDVSDSELRSLRHTLRRWITKDRGSRGQEVIYYPLKANYRWEYFSKSHLRREDLHRVNHLQDISAKIPFEIFFATIQKKNNHDPARETGQSTKREASIYGLHCHRITNSSIFIDEEDLVSHTHLEHAAITIIPRDTILSFFHGTDSWDAIESLWINYARACLKEDYAPSTVVVFKQICNFMMARTAENTDGHWANLKMAPKHLLDVVEALCATRCYTWFSRFGLHYVRDLPRYAFSRLGERRDIAYMSGEESYKDIDAVLLGMILEYPRPAQQIRAVKEIISMEQMRSQNGRPRPRLAQVLRYCLPFVRQVLKACIEACGTKQLTAQDGQALVGFSLYFDEPFAILSLIKDKIGLERQPAAILGLIHKVDYYGKSGYLPKEEALQFSRGVAISLIASTDFAQWRGIADGHYFKRDEENAKSYVDYFDDEDSDLEDWLHRGNSQPLLSNQKRLEQRWQKAQHEGYLRDDYDEHEYRYADSYRNCLYIDKGPLKRSKDQLDENRYKELYGISQSFTFSRPGTEEKGIHYRSLYCFFEQLLRPIEQFDEVLELLVSKVVNTAPHIPHTEFDTLWIPLTKEFIPCVHIFGELVDTARKSLMSGLLSAILKAYVNTWVGQYPKRPSLVREGVQCSCPDCKGLNVFLADPSLRAGKFKADGTRAQHIIDGMTRANVDFKSDMMEDADSVTLTVIKTTRLFAQSLRQWAYRRYHASREVAKFGQTGLEFIFGTEWMSFMSMAHLGGVGFDNLEIRTLSHDPQEEMVGGEFILGRLSI
ncbi:hypothetical protein THARTR1_00956 [Trichoderma harzianum]|uniref:Uncharacterized protein n=1 Tax=Trichoderma harzianum TaxID=5544 RepID=A0A2K0UNV3_TRIHA|nr:hypothetical protein THARTR1_00956 [Trichoderma harzianum]